MVETDFKLTSCCFPSYSQTLHQQLGHDVDAQKLVVVRTVKTRLKHSPLICPRVNTVFEAVIIAIKLSLIV